MTEDYSFLRGTMLKIEGIGIVGFKDNKFDDAYNDAEIQDDAQRRVTRYLLQRIFERFGEIKYIDFKMGTDWAVIRFAPQSECVYKILTDAATQPIVLGGNQVIIKGLRFEDEIAIFYDGYRRKKENQARKQNIRQDLYYPREYSRPPRDFPQRDYMPRDYPPRDLPPRDYPLPEREPYRREPEFAREQPYRSGYAPYNPFGPGDYNNFSSNYPPRQPPPRNQFDREPREFRDHSYGDQYPSQSRGRPYQYGQPRQLYAPPTDYYKASQEDTTGRRQFK